ncbi:MAG: chlorite dismutase, partial [Acidobacteriaceae bacterium]
MTNAATTEIATETAHAAATQTAPAKEAPKEKELKRQIVSFQFFKVMPEWRRLPAAERADH